MLQSVIKCINCWRSTIYVLQWYNRFNTIKYLYKQLQKQLRHRNKSRLCDKLKCNYNYNCNYNSYFTFWFYFLNLFFWIYFFEFIFTNRKTTIIIVIYNCMWQKSKYIFKLVTELWYTTAIWQIAGRCREAAEW